MQGSRTARPAITVVSGIKIGVMNVCFLWSKLNYLIDHAIENELDFVVLTETWLSNVEKNNAILANARLDHGYTLPKKRWKKRIGSVTIRLVLIYKMP